MSILSELKKLTGKDKATIISEALPDSMGGGGGLSAVYLVEKALEPIDNEVRYGLYFMDLETEMPTAPFTFEDAQKYSSHGSNRSIIILDAALIACTLGVITDLQRPTKVTSFRFGIIGPSTGSPEIYEYYEYSDGDLVANSDGAMVRFDGK